jgi:hypothetical protein
LCPSCPSDDATLHSSRAYFVFCDENAGIDFIQAVKGHKFATSSGAVVLMVLLACLCHAPPLETGAEFTCQAEFALNQKYPTGKPPRDHREGLLVADSTYKAFLAAREAPKPKPAVATVPTGDSDLPTPEAALVAFLKRVASR